jgi:hypothetical protein
MYPWINSTGFGYIVVEGSRIENDIVIRLSGKIRKRKKKLSRTVHGTSHIVSRDEAKHIYQDHAERIIVGSGQSGRLILSEEALEYFEKRNCRVDLFPTNEAIEHWNEAKDSVVGLFHITC